MMKLDIIPAKDVLNKAWLSQNLTLGEVEQFVTALQKYLGAIESKQDESEEHCKNLFITFLKEGLYPDHYLNTDGKADAVIAKSVKDQPEVLIEVKRPKNQSEFVAEDHANKKALHELLLYYMRQRQAGNNQIKHLVLTNCHVIYLIDENWFDTHAWGNQKLKTEFHHYEEEKRTDQFYKDIAEPFFDRIEKLPAYRIDLWDYASLVGGDSWKPGKNAADSLQISTLYKVLAPRHLLKQPYLNAANVLDKGFYAELLWILGLKEYTDPITKKVLIVRLDKHERKGGSLLENALAIILSEKDEEKLDASQLESYGDNPDEQYFTIAFELCVTWLNRVLFLKLLEGQLMRYHPQDTRFAFLNSQIIKDFDELNKLFFRVLAKDYPDREPSIVADYGHIPYLNSSLFEPTFLETKVLKISGIDDSLVLPYYHRTVLKDADGKARTGSISTLAYLLQFLDAYSFNSEGSGIIQNASKTMISAKVLGLFFEKINGYKDGSIYTPDYITEYMARQTLTRLVLDRFREEYQIQAGSLDELANQLQYTADKLKAYNQTVNSLKICDPAVGSGHFLVSVLNELLHIKSQLGILMDAQGKRLSNWATEVENDELIVYNNASNEIFQYQPLAKGVTTDKHEPTRLQRTLFHEKQRLIESCLFGVDINPNSVKICRLRLWIELLKNAYYNEQYHLETLPNIDINIKEGNSLNHRFPIHQELTEVGVKRKIEEYKGWIQAYHKATHVEEKKGLRALIEGIDNSFRQQLAKTDPLIKRRDQVSSQLYELMKPQLFELSAKEKTANQKQIDKVEKELAKLQEEVKEEISGTRYKNALEWRFAFPQVLDAAGDFVGFDLVIGNPPYIKEADNKHIFSNIKKKGFYLGKMDLWYGFAHVGIDITRENGYLAFIATNNWITNAGAKKLRELIFEKCTQVVSVDFHNNNIFESASIQTMILVLRKKQPSIGDVHLKLDVSDRVEESQIREKLQDVTSFIKLQQQRFNNKTVVTIIDDEKRRLVEKMHSNCMPCLDSKDDIFQGIVFPQDVVNKKSAHILGEPQLLGHGVFLLSKAEIDKLGFDDNDMKVLRPYFTSKQIGRYISIDNTDKYLIYTDKTTLANNGIDNFLGVKKHLDRFLKIITSDNAPYGLHRARKEDVFLGPKIISIRKCLIPSFSYNEFDCFVSQTFNIIKTTKLGLKPLTGLLNSKLAWFWFKYNGKIQGNILQIDNEPLSRFPIVRFSEESELLLNSLVTKILLAKAVDPAADTSSLEREIDELVYQLYELTPEEIAIVEGG